MSQTSRSTRLDFSSRAAKTAAQGFEFIRDFGALAADHVDLFGAELDPADYAGSSLEGMSKADIGALVAAYPQIDAILSANDGAIRKAVKRLAQFNR